MSKNIQIKQIDQSEESKLKFSKWLDMTKQVHIFPTIYAANEAPPPKKPNLMTAKELPLYKTPHADYNEYTYAQNYECANRTTPTFAETNVQPIVTSARHALRSNYDKGRIKILATYTDFYNKFSIKLNETKTYLRADQNLAVSQTLVVLGGLAGFCYVRKCGIPTKLLNSGLGAGAMGALCFPRETDQIVKNLGQTFVVVVNAIHVLLHGVPYFIDYKCLKNEPKSKQKQDMEIKCD